MKIHNRFSKKLYNLSDAIRDDHIKWDSLYILRKEINKYIYYIINLG